MRILFQILVLISLVLQSQVSKAELQDSILSLLQGEIHDTLRIELLGELSKSMFGTNPTQAIEYANEAVDLARERNDTERLGNALKNAGLGYYYLGDFVEVLENWQASLVAYESIGDTKGVSNLLSNIGAVYYSTGDNTKAIEYYLRALRISENAGDDFRTATVLQNIGAVYENTEEYEKAKNYLLRALEMCEKLNYDKGVATTSLNLGEIYFQDDDYEEASKYYEISRDVFQKMDDQFLPNVLIKIGQLNTKRGDYGSGLRTLQEAYDMAASKGGKVPMAMAKLALGDAYFDFGVSRKAIDAYLDAVELGENIGQTEELKETYEGLTKAYKARGDYLNVARYQDSLLRTTQAIYDIEKNKRLSNLQLSFDIEKKESEIELLNADNEIKSQQIARANLFRNFLLATAVFLLVLVGGVFYQYKYTRRTNKIITEERNKAEHLLLNILPQETAEELKIKGSVDAKKYEFATVLFTDFVGFTIEAGKVEPEALVKSVDYYFRNFDEIIGNNNLEKIKTIGDSYMCVGGLPKENTSNAMDAIKAAEEIIKFVEETKNNPPEGITSFNIRIGINSGPLVAGVVGTRKFQYDIWGDTVNVASRMESNCEPNHINVSENVFQVLKNDIPFEYRGKINVKNKGKMKMYYLDRVGMN